MGTRCKCGEAMLFVVSRNCNRSAFNGYRETRSAYSGVSCASCLAHFRTKGKYVLRLPDAPKGWWNMSRTTLVTWRVRRNGERGHGRR